MSVDLDLIPAVAKRPKRPIFVYWLLFYCVILVIIIAIGLVFFPNETSKNLTTLFTSVTLIWAFIFLMRSGYYYIENSWADGWDKKRQEILDHEEEKGYRSLSILAATMNCAHAIPAQKNSMSQQIHSLIQGEKALINQVSIINKKTIRHSQLPLYIDLSVEKRVSAILTDTLDGLVETLKKISTTKILNVSLDVNSTLSQELIVHIWKNIWDKLSLDFKLVMIDKKGVLLIDEWLDKEQSPHSILLVLALNLTPENLELSGEAAVGLVLSTQDLEQIPTLSRLYRPEKYTTETVGKSINLALKWSNYEYENIQYRWISRLSDKVREDVFLHDQKSEGDTIISHDLMYLLGNIGSCDPWLQIASSAYINNQKNRCNLIVSRDENIIIDQGWSMVVGRGLV